MPKVLEHETVRVHLQIYKEDWDYVCLVFDGKNGHKPGPMVRDLIHQAVGILRARAVAKQDAQRRA